MARLVFYKGEIQVIETRIPSGTIMIGRADTCDIALPDDEVSRVHCHIVRTREGISIVDRSRHGTFVNGVRVQRAELVDGDRIRIGSFLVVVELQDRGEEHPATAPVARDTSHEQLVGGDVGGMEVVRLSVRVTAGPAMGVEIPLPSSDSTVGREGQVVVADPDLLARHFRLVIHRGRAMVAPLEGAVTVDHERIRMLYPLLPGEPFCAGGSTFLIAPTRAQEVHESTQFGEMIGESQPMRRVFGMLHRMAGFPETVLLLGESGTGKELAARGLHESSPRRSGPFMAVNCGAITEGLFESELFGHEKGSFTGAAGRRDGAFHQAHGGTLFLDEVGEIPVGAQAKLLRALESGEVRRVGSDVPSFPDVRVVAATNRNLLEEVSRGQFREDLYFRLAVLTVKLPSLRERPEDIPLLCRVIARGLGTGVLLSPAALDLLQGYPWPGNVRELRNVLTRAYVLHGPIIDAGSISFSSGSSPGVQQEDPRVMDAERSLCLAALARHRGNRAAAARELGLPRTTFIYKLQRLGVEG